MAQIMWNIFIERRNSEDAIKPIDETVSENDTKSVNFEGKLAYKIVRANSLQMILYWCQKHMKATVIIGSVILEESLTPR